MAVQGKVVGSELLLHTTLVFSLYSAPVNRLARQGSLSLTHSDLLLSIFYLTLRLLLHYADLKPLIVSVLQDGPRESAVYSIR